ncbi:Fe3+-siderophore ABC transporter permease [Bordetella holmesii]|uniref:Iron chelate uptake ABC transporter, FeCT family, permease domain protein n=3 Tax=Bordetella holmesii TaxID=35814 RepID=A0A158M0K9_9BORD|nr:Fe3+-siderophore ABC transporter permease [Bordetella holmesii H558]AOB36547.1 Fe3+-siderophore ABC transporter permease [Bordetella holmesii]KAK83459.1 iron chelate uptake ABC transporter, FeCT family, permease domain protein [Bordetella holmesii CDC-H572-BH]KAK83810.1 iron chelate uptake ABC transporter, FeCT family, permease domain protein [Bordetella holmesii CDC-H809-BH]KAK86581.1 iron chelate uptake ABC transporter, FeCT family, permease domain protein [Bordetella holmesii CDC-H585-BH]
MNWGVGDFQFLKSGSDEPCIQPIESSQLVGLCLGVSAAAAFGAALAITLDWQLPVLPAALTVSVCAFAAALAVSFVGTVGFVGLVAPHIARVLAGEDHRFYLPASAMAGALIMSLASVASKTLLPGVLVPVGIVTALVGIPFFLTIVVRAMRRG